MAVKVLRSWEKTERKIARYKNHLHFTLHCKHHGLMPPSLRIKSSMKGARVDNILRRTERLLMAERISGIYHVLDKLQNERAECDEHLFMCVHGDDIYTEAKNWVAHAHKAEWNKCQQRQQNKFQILQNKANSGQKEQHLASLTQEQVSNVINKWVVNKSSHVLSENETKVLQKGLNFAITPENVPLHEMIVCVETACHIVGNSKGEADSIRNKCVHLMKHSNPPRSNITPGEREAIKSLRADKDIMVLPADKGRAVVVLDKREYKEKANKLLSDEKTYRKEKKDPTKKYARNLSASLKKLKEDKVLDEYKYRHLLHTSAEPPKFYGLPKIHKSDMPLRPIVSSRGSITYNTAKFVADIIKPLMGKTPHHLHNSQDLISKLKNVVVSETEEMVSYDVTALFTSVPVNDSLTIIHGKLERDSSLSDRTNLTVDNIIELLRCCLNTTYFLYDGEFYTQN